jgi:hypothetical protein
MNLPCKLIRQDVPVTSGPDLYELLGVAPDTEIDRLRHVYESHVADAVRSHDLARAAALSRAFDRLPATSRRALYGSTSSTSAASGVATYARRRRDARGDHAPATRVPPRVRRRFPVALLTAVALVIAVGLALKHHLHLPGQRPAAVAPVVGPVPTTSAPVVPPSPTIRVAPPRPLLSPSQRQRLDDWRIRAGLYEANDQPYALPYVPDSGLGSWSDECRVQAEKLEPFRRGLVNAPDAQLAAAAKRYDRAARWRLRACIRNHPVALHHADGALDVAASAVNTRYARLLGLDPSSPFTRHVL